MDKKKEGNQGLSRTPLENSLKEPHLWQSWAPHHMPHKHQVTCFSYASSCLESCWVARHISFCREKRKAGKICPTHVFQWWPKKEVTSENPLRMYVCVCKIIACSEIIWKTRPKQIKRLKQPAFPLPANHLQVTAPSGQYKNSYIVPNIQQRRDLLTEEAHIKKLLQAW